MPTIAVLGATGYLGGHLIRELPGRGWNLVAVTRERGRGSAALDDSRIAVDEIRFAEATAPDALGAALEGCDVAVGAYGPVDGVTTRVIDAAIEAGVHLVDLSGAPQLVRWVFEERDAAARAAGVTVVPGCTAAGVVGDLLADVAAAAVVGPREVHLASTSLGRADRPSEWPRSLRTPGEWRELATQVGNPVPAWTAGMSGEEWPGEQRRLAWFPRPVGPSHAAAVAAPHAVTVPRHVPGVSTVRSYRALPVWRAELLQASANLARIETVARWRARRLLRDRGSPSPAARAARRWAMVAEVGNGREVARAWANGRSLDRVAAVGALLLVESILAGRADVGVLPPAHVDVPTDLLDRLSSRVDLRWSVVRPEA